MYFFSQLLNNTQLYSKQQVFDYLSGNIKYKMKNNYNSRMTRSNFINVVGKRTIRTQLERIPQYSFPNRTNRHQSFYLLSPSKKHRLQQQKNTEIERNNRILCQKIRTIMMKGKHQKSKQKQQQEQINKKQLLLTFMKPDKLPTLSPPSRTFKRIQGLTDRNKSALSSILNERQKFIDGYFQSIKSTREMIKQKRINMQFAPVQIGKWNVQGLVYENAVVLRGFDGKRQLTKKYPYLRVRQKIEEDYEKWVQSKFHFQT